ncbi:MAG: dihydropteroate synthase [Dehalococcoidia bacterium]|nr:dihydropteroate synthase [Dehalococcoidia bacterium]
MRLHHGQDFEPLPVEEELARLLPSLEAVRAATTLPISVDTYQPGVAQAAFAAGADAVNDIHGLAQGPELARVAAEQGAAVFAMYNHRDQETRDVAGDIRAGFEAAIAAATQAGLPLERLVLDPGFGFGWTPEENLEMLRRLPELWELEMPLLVGTSRKSTIGYVLDAPVEERLEGTAATVALAIGGGADMLRVHDVTEMGRVAKVSDAIVRDNWRQA